MAYLPARFADYPYMWAGRRAIVATRRAAAARAAGNAHFAELWAAAAGVNKEAFRDGAETRAVCEGEDA